MNENTAKLLEKLAQKMGTTSEYLWKVLLSQAPIDATVNLIQFIGVIIGGIVLLKVHKWLAKEDEYGDNRYDNSFEERVLMVIAAIVFFVLFFICFCCIGDIISGYFNPEYWALKRVLDSIK